MMIDTDFNSETGYNGFDYLINIRWNTTSQTWERPVIKYSPDGNEIRTIQETNNFTGFFGREFNEYVLLSFDLDIIGSPTKYKVLFYANAFEGAFERTEFPVLMGRDVSRWVPIPPPEFSISTSPSSIAIRPGEEKNVELKLLSNTEFESYIDLSTAAIPKIESNIIPNRIAMSSNGESTSVLKVKALENSTAGIVLLPVQTNISIIQPSAEAKSDSTSGLRRPWDFLHFVPSQDISQSTNLTVSVLPQLTFVEKYGNLISIVALVTLVDLPTIFSATPYFYKRLPHLDKIDISDVLQVDGAVIAGALILLTLTTTTGVSDDNRSSTGGLILTQRSFITADIVFPFAISAIVALLKINERSRFHQFETRLMIAGFLNLMISIILLTIIGY
jgi:hypothetical protein